MRTRKRRASNLADDLTKDGIKAYFEEKERQKAMWEAKMQAQDEDAKTMEETVAEPIQSEIPLEKSEPKSVQSKPKPVQAETQPPKYTPHELPEHLKRIVEGYGNGHGDDDKSLGDW